MNVRELDGGGCFYLVRSFRPATHSDVQLMHGLNPAWWAPRREAKTFEVIALGQIGGKVHDRPFFKAKGPLPSSGDDYPGAAASDAPARLVSFRL